jgi:hypothetical protein
MGIIDNPFYFRLLFFHFRLFFWWILLVARGPLRQLRRMTFEH